MKKIILTAIASGVLLAGCATTLSPEEQASERAKAQAKYDKLFNSWSDANKLSAPFGIRYKDKKVSSDSYRELSSTDLSMGFASFEMAKYGVLTSYSIADFGTSILVDALSTPSYKTNDQSFGYVQASEATTPEAAATLYGTRLIEAFQKGIKETKGLGEVAYVWRSGFRHTRFLGSDYYTEDMAITIKDEAKGCYYPKKEGKDLCQINIGTRLPPDVVTNKRTINLQKDFYFGKPTQAWVIAPTSVIVSGSLEDFEKDNLKFDFSTLYANVNKHLYDGMYIFHRETTRGYFRAKETPPVVYSRGKVNFYVVPENKK